MNQQNLSTNLESFDLVTHCVPVLPGSKRGAMVY
jgi:hypothetical protein